MLITKPKKSIFIHEPIHTLNKNEEMYLWKLKDIIKYKSTYENIGYVPGSLSEDNKIRPLILSRNILHKIQSDHGRICPENIVINAHRWEHATTNVLGNPDKINLIKTIPDSKNYLLIAAVRVNGFFILTHFETKTSGSTNLKRLLGRRNVISRGPSIGL